ncbi:hypothetical protein D3C76_1079480 [compost metagenome]
MPACKPLTIWLSPAPICCIACINWPISSRRVTSTVPLKSPAAICCATRITLRSGPTINRVITQAAINPTSNASAEEPMISSELFFSSACIDWSSATYAWSTRSTTWAAR